MVQYLLDTNILLAWIRLGVLQAFLQATYQLDTISPPPIISIVTEAELRSLAIQNQWGTGKQHMLRTWLRRLIAVPIPYRNIVDAYVEIDNYSRAQGRKMGKNDLWIAATARVENATLLTTDQDFGHLPQSLVKHIYIAPASHL